MYEAAGDPYCYKGTSVLRNIPGFRDHERLERFETVMVAERARESLPRGALTIGHYRSVHRHLFQDVYRWAGRYRSVRIHKEGSTFCYPEHIPGQMKALFSRLREAEFYAGLAPPEFARQAAHFLADLNAIHPFREGNGRSQLSFVALIAVRAGHSLVLERLDPETFLGAMVSSFGGDEVPLVQQLRGLMIE